MCVPVIHLLAGHIRLVNLRVWDHFRGRSQFRLNPSKDVETPARPSHFRDSHHPELTALVRGIGIGIRDFFASLWIGTRDRQNFFHIALLVLSLPQDINRRSGKPGNVGQRDYGAGNNHQSKGHDTSGKTTKPAKSPLTALRSVGLFVFEVFVVIHTCHCLSAAHTLS